MFQPFQISIHFTCFDFFRGDRSGLCGVNLLRCPTLHLGDVRLPSGAVRNVGKGWKRMEKVPGSFGELCLAFKPLEDLSTYLVLECLRN